MKLTTFSDRSNGVSRNCGIPVSEVIENAPYGDGLVQASHLIPRTVKLLYHKDLKNSRKRNQVTSKEVT